MAKRYFSKAEIKDKLNLREEDFDVKDGTFRLRELSGLQRLEAEDRAAKAGTPENPNNAIFRAKIFQLAVIDPDSKQRMFDDGDVEWLTAQSNNGVFEVAVKVLTMNGIGAAELKSAGDTPDAPESGPPDGAPTSGAEPETVTVQSA